jgi:hypothetical protein
MVDQPSDGKSNYEGGAPPDAVVITPEQRQALQEAAQQAGIVQAPAMAGSVVSVPPPSGETRPDPVPPPGIPDPSTGVMHESPQPTPAAPVAGNVVQLPRPDLSPDHAANKIADEIGDADEFVRWLKNGKIQIRLLVETQDGPQPREWLLRRPKIKHLRRLREFYEDLVMEEQMAGLARSDVLRARQKLVSDEGKTFVEAAEALPTPDQPEEQTLRWIEEVFSLLADHPLGIDREDLPGWFDNAELVTKFFEKWRALPLALGT